jgi:hypothetical protein
LATIFFRALARLWRSIQSNLVFLDSALQQDSLGQNKLITTGLGPLSRRIEAKDVPKRHEIDQNLSLATAPHTVQTGHILILCSMIAFRRQQDLVIFQQDHRRSGSQQTRDISGLAHTEPLVS